MFFTSSKEGDKRNDKTFVKAGPSFELFQKMIRRKIIIKLAGEVPKKQNL